MTENMLQHHHFHWNKPNMSYIICAFHRGDLESHILLSYSTSLNFPPKKKQKQNHLLPVFWWGRKPVKLYWFLLISGDTPAPQVLPTFQAWRSTVNHCSPWRSDAAGMTTMVTCCMWVWWWTLKNIWLMNTLLVCFINFLWDGVNDFTFHLKSWSQAMLILWKKQAACGYDLVMFAYSFT